MLDFETIQALQDDFAKEETHAQKRADHETLIKAPNKIYSSLALEPVLLKSALFKATTGPRAAYPEYTRVASHGSRQIWLKCDEELRQDDQRVLLMLVRQRIGQHVTNEIEFVPRTFARDVLRWADSSDSVARLKASLKRLFSAHIRVDYEVPEDGDYHHFIGSMSFRGEKWSVQLGPSLVKSFQRRQTYMHPNQRLGIKDGLGSWLLGFLLSDKFEDKPDLVLETNQMRLLSGHDTYAQKAFNQKLKGELEKLIKLKVVKEFVFKGAVLLVTRAPTPKAHD